MSNSLRSGELKPVYFLALALILIPSTFSQAQDNSKETVDSFDWQFLHQITYRSYDNPQPADNTLRVYMQPNGTEFMARLRGVESYHWYETADGRVFQLNRQTGYYEYAVLDSGGRYKLSGVLVGIDDPADYGIEPYIREPKEIIRQKVEKYLGPPRPVKAAPAVFTQTEGTVKQVVILSRFFSIYDDPSDFSPYFEQDDFDRLFNEIGCDLDGNHGSFRDYYREVSYGKLRVQSAVTDWVMLPEARNYYGSINAYGENVTARYKEFVRDSILALDESGFDFSNYDSDDDGYVDAVCIVHQGIGGEVGGGTNLWSKKVTLDTPIDVDGVTIAQAIVVPELSYESLLGRDDPARIVHVGVFVHEFGHLLGLKDLYDPSKDHRANGVGQWCVMSKGQHLDEERQPSHQLAYQKIKLGWITPRIISRTTSRITLKGLDRTGDALMIRYNMGSNKYILLENRQQRGFDGSLPGHGLIVTLVDEDVSQNIDPTHYHVAVLQADGKLQLEGIGGFGLNEGDDGDPFPGSSNIHNIGPDTFPSTDNHRGRNTGIYISNIMEDRRKIVLDIGIDEEPPYPFWPGPDDFGYVGRLTTGGFEDISESGTTIVFDDEDDGIKTVSFPSDFQFYFYKDRDSRVRSDLINKITVSTNGWIAMGSRVDDPMPMNKRMPDADTPNYLIAPLWKDLRVDENGLYVKYKLKGSKPNRTFIVQWRAERKVESRMGTKALFQVKLHEEGHLEFCYDRVGWEAITATIGIQKDGLVGLCYSYVNERPLSDGDRIIIAPQNNEPFGYMVTPGNGRGFGTTFSARYIDPDGVDDLKECYFLINTSSSTNGGVYIRYDNETNKISMRNSADTRWFEGTPGGNSTFATDWVNLELAGVTVGKGGNTLTLGIPLEFKDPFTGEKNIYLKANDRAGFESEWVSSWTYSVEENHPPELVHVLPASGKGYEQIFRAKYSDLNGHEDLRYLYFMVSKELSTANSVYIMYDVRERRLLLRNANDDAWYKGSIGGTGTLSNGNVTIDLSESAAIINPLDPNHIELVLRLSFQQIYTGSKNVYMKAEDLNGQIADWQIMGTWWVN